MTVSETSTRELDIDRIVMLAIQTAGVLPAGAARSGRQWDNLSAQARDFLEINVDHMQALGTFARSIELYDVLATADVDSYDLPPTTLIVVGDAQFSSTADTGSTFVRQIGREEYLGISDRTSKGRPSIFYSQMHAVTTLFLWPIPDVDGTLEIQRGRLLADNDDGSLNVDLERHWTKFVLYDLAHSIAVANSVNPIRCGYLRQQADAALGPSKRLATSKGPGRAVLCHPTGWRR
jgi:hypothetical protein